MSSAYFYSGVLGFTIGIFFHSFFDFGFYFSLFILLLTLALFLILFVFSYQKKHYGKNAIRILILGLFFTSLGLIRFDISNLEHNPSALYAFSGSKIMSEGIVVDEPNIGESNQKLIVRVNSISLLQSKEVEDPAQNIVATENILVSTDLYPEFFYGDRVQIEGKLERPKNFTTPGEKPFDYVAYLAKDNIFYTISFAKVSFVSHGNGNFIQGKLFALKNALFANLRKVLPEPHASLAGGLILGGKNVIGKDLEKDFRTAGVIHIIVLSGYNIMIVSEGIMKTFSFLPRAGGLMVGGISLVLFAIMTGGGATVVRASVMALIALFGRYIGKTYAVNRALFLAGFLMLVHNPKILVFDFSFQLSFLATLGLIHLSPLVERKILFITKKYNIREYVVSTIATQIIVLPLILYRMGEISIVSLPVNILVLFFVPWTMGASFATSVLAFFGTIIAMPTAFITYLFVAYELKVVELFSKLPGASLHLNFFPVWMMAGIYILYFYIFFRIRKRSPHLLEALPATSKHS